MIPNGNKLTLSGMLFFLLWMTGCMSEEPRTVANERQTHEELAFGSAECVFTGETIETVRYGGRIEMRDGQQLDFMSVECLAGYYLGLKDQDDVALIQVVDFTHGKRLLNVDEMTFLHSKLRPSPNGLFLTAIEAADNKMVNYIYNAYSGPLLSWEEVLELVRDEWGIGRVAEAAGPEAVSRGRQ